jgi:hypothetical protein
VAVLVVPSMVARGGAFLTDCGGAALGIVPWAICNEWAMGEPC